MMFVKCYVNCESLFQYFANGQSFTLRDYCYILTLGVFLSYENYSVLNTDEEIVYPGTIVHIEIYVLKKKCMNKALFLGLK